MNAQRLQPSAVTKNAAPRPCAAYRSSDARRHASKSPVRSLVDIARAAGDQLRLDILRLLARESFAVLELCRILDVAQPALSHHLKVLQQAGLLTRRREGTSLFYRRVLQHSEHAALVDSLFASMDGLAENPSQQTQVGAIHAERRMRSEAFFSANAELLVEQRTRISDPETYSEAAAELLALVADDSITRPRRALEIGPGEGQLLTLLADRYEAVLGIDSTAQMLDPVKAALGSKPNIKLRVQDFAELPARRYYNAVVAAMVLHHQASPPGFFCQAYQLLKPGGVFLLVDLCRHNQEWVRDICGDFWLGFEPDELLGWAAAAGFAPPASQYLTQNNGFQIQLHAFSKV